MTGPIGQPLRAGASVIDIMGAMFGVIAAQAALRERDATGKGQRVSSALFENAAFLMSTHMAGMIATGLEARPMPGAAGRLGDLRGVQHRRWRAALYRHHQRPAMDAFCRGIRLARAGGRPAPRDQRDAAGGTLVAHPRLAGGAGSNSAKRSRPPLRACQRALGTSWATGRSVHRRAFAATGGLVDMFISRFGEPGGKMAGLRGRAQCRAAE